ncbi:uncharacterized protein LOC128670298 [Plodia interpunctella]|uniref:uncharacterized protein LOC128670298 n=1 Tax=Plodia interpunctella TaxID=58824 RepID=UPI0023679E25|nr:uncharacterized protein LOC128670298 [Plodia interpunctella]XP_053601836.1 uncharacterized protein LOC128670298 [Plodia interpunctella]
MNVLRYLYIVVLRLCNSTYLLAVMVTFYLFISMAMTSFISRTMCKMSHFFGNLVLFLLVNCVYVEGGRPRNKFVYEKEISEHCMRRVMPSVFLGRHVVDAYAQVLYFSKADLPYSCYISVRAESGSNIILVVQLISADDLIAACEENGDQLLVYELGETFGGYWGPMPQSFIHPDSNMSEHSTRADSYTIKPTEPTREPINIETSSSMRITYPEHVDVEHNDKENNIVDDSSYVTIMVPLANVSGRFRPGIEDKESAFEDENFDVIYDVLPRLREPYRTTIMPLVQFSVDLEPGGQRWGYEDLMSGYSLGLNWNTFTPDHRLKHQKYNASVNRRLTFKPNIMRRPISHKHSTLFSAIHGDSVNSKKMEPIKHSKYVPITTSKPKSEPTDTILNEDIEPWKYIEELISAYNKSGQLTTISEDELRQEVSELIKKLSDLEYNQSAYLSPQLATNKSFSLTRKPILINRDSPNINDHYNSPEKTINSTTILPVTKSTNTAKSLEELQEIMHTVTSTTIEMTKSTESYEMMSNNFTTTKNSEKISDLNVTEDKISNLNTIATEKLSIVEPIVTPKLRATAIGSLLDHESWENLLRVAPAMAGRLEETMPQNILEELEKSTDSGNDSNIENLITTETLFNSTNASQVTKTRDKRFIQGIMIEEAKPHRLTTIEEVATTTSASIHISDIQHFAQLVELIDDDIHDRAALRYLSQYVGQPMFNLCSYEQPKPRFVQLFKSSRLVVAIGNFTLRSMQLVMTPAKLLFTSKSRCGQSHLECQVAGNRVCIDAMSACDGVANCGTPDIYDEDRLMCGAYLGLRHNVCLAAITFIAVLLTLIYMVHYWLGRCVPKVSEAFFIYTEGDENVLYLDSVMRSPHDDSIPGSKSLDAFETDAIFTMGSGKEPKGHSWLYKLFPCCCKKKDKNMTIVSQDSDEIPGSISNTMFTFPELEIRRMINLDYKNTSVQTGESLEMSYLRAIRRTTKEAGEGFSMSPDLQQPRNWTSPISSDEQQRLRDELSLLKVLNKNRDDSLSTRTNYDFVKQDVTFSDLSVNNEHYEYPDEREIKSQFYDPRWMQDRRLSEGLTRVTKYEVESEKPKTTPSKRLRFSEEVVNIPRIDEVIDEESATKCDETNQEEQIPSTSRDFKRFWGGSKNKKTKKKTQTLSR